MTQEQLKKGKELLKRIEVLEELRDKIINELSFEYLNDLSEDAKACWVNIREAYLKDIEDKIIASLKLKINNLSDEFKEL